MSSIGGGTASSDVPGNGKNGPFPRLGVRAADHRNIRVLTCSNLTHKLLTPMGWLGSRGGPGTPTFEGLTAGELRLLPDSLTSPSSPSSRHDDTINIIMNLRDLAILSMMPQEP